MYHRLNIVTAESGTPEAISLRAGAPVSGHQLMGRQRYNCSYKELTAKQKRELAGGPGRLCQALEITRQQDGDNIVGSED